VKKAEAELVQAQALEAKTASRVKEAERRLAELHE
jgi:hypothetical protein